MHGFGDFDAITVQNILDRARVGRATFYSHYRNKDDVLYSSYEELFAYLAQSLDGPASRSQRLAPVEEFLAHIGESGAFVQSLRAAGKLDDMLNLGVDFLARIIQERIVPASGASSPMPASLIARMLAGALMEMIKWWLDHCSTSTPEHMDRTFHAFAHDTLYRAGYMVVARR